MDHWRAGSALSAPPGSGSEAVPDARSAAPSGIETRFGAWARTTGCALAILATLGSVLPAAAADYRMKPVRPRDPPPPPVVEYVPPPPAPLACGTVTQPHYDEAHCYGEYRPWRQEGCWWRHGFYVCPKPRTAYGPVHGFH